MLLMKRLGFLFMIFLAAASERDAQAQTVDAVRDYTMVIEPLSTECERVRNPGDLCSPTLDVVYLGDGVSGRKLFTTFLALPATQAWNAGNTTSMTRTDLLSSIFGASNGATLVATDSSTATGFQTHNAASACEALVHGQYDDWYRT